MKRLASFLVCIIALSVISPAWAGDSTTTPQGTAIQPDIDQKGANIKNVGDLDTNTLEASSATISGGLAAGSVSTTNGAITSLNTGTTFVQNSPTNSKHATNKEYVDAQLTALETEIKADTSGELITIPTKRTLTYAGGKSKKYTKYYKYTCPSGYTAVLLGKGSSLGSSGTSGGKIHYSVANGVCVKNSAYVALGHYITTSTKTYDGGTDN